MKTRLDWIKACFASVEITIDSIVPLPTLKADYGINDDDNMEINDNKSKYEDVKGCGAIVDGTQRVDAQVNSKGQRLSRRRWKKNPMSQRRDG